MVKKEDKYILTVRGWLNNEKENLYDSLCLYMLRIGRNAIVFNNGQLDWVNVEEVRNEKNKQIRTKKVIKKNPL